MALFFLFGFYSPSVLPTSAGEIWTDPWFKSRYEWFYGVDGKLNHFGKCFVCTSSSGFKRNKKQHKLAPTGAQPWIDPFAHSLCYATSLNWCSVRWKGKNKKKQKTEGAAVLGQHHQKKKKKQLWKTFLKLYADAAAKNKPPPIFPHALKSGRKIKWRHTERLGSDTEHPNTHSHTHKLNKSNWEN